MPERLILSCLAEMLRRCNATRKLGVPYFGDLIKRILYYLGYYIRVPYFRNSLLGILEGIVHSSVLPLCLVGVKSYWLRLI